MNSPTEDPRLRSIHLPRERREKFRTARTELVAACGDRTRRLVPRRPINSLDTIKEGLGEGAPPSKYHLVDRSKVIQLHEGINTIGRLSSNDVVVSDPQVSRRHAAIIVHADGKCEIHDLASKNGTFVNGERVGSCTRIEEGSMIQLGNHGFLFISGDLEGEVEHMLFCSSATPPVE